VNWHQGDSEDKHIQFVPAEKGWLALFEETTGQGVKIHASPVVAWCLGAREMDDGHHVVSFGQAVVGASPWLEKADVEHSAHFFALMREEQLDADLVDELRISARHSREDIEALAKDNQVVRKQGHSTWRRLRRVERTEKSYGSAVRIFSMSQ
jgi:hypothetical protein